MSNFYLDRLACRVVYGVNFPWRSWWKCENRWFQRNHAVAAWNGTHHTTPLSLSYCKHVTPAPTNCKHSRLAHFFLLDRSCSHTNILVMHEGTHEHEYTNTLIRTPVSKFWLTASYQQHTVMLCSTTLHTPSHAFVANSLYRHYW